MHFFLKHSLLLLAMFMCTCITHAQNDWILKKEKDGIQVYFKDSETSKIKELKIELTVRHEFDKVVSALNDVEACTEWVYACKAVHVLESEGQDKILYYTIVDFPWPLQDRDAYISSQNTYSETTYISTSHGLLNYKSADKNMVRIPEINIEWFAEKINDGEVFIRYTLHSDPGGIIPAWAINLAMDKGPVQSMKAFVEFLKKVP